MRKGLLIAGLLVPGLGSLLRGRLGEAVVALWTVVFFLAVAVVDLAVWNGAGPFSGATARKFDVVAAIQFMPQHLNIPPTVPLAVVLALAVHVLAAVGAARRDPG
jgi:hypothetical protein